MSLLSIDALEAAAARAEVAGHRPRILILAHPNNPMGFVTPPDQLLAAVRWARSRGMHTISDEIYANSVHSEAVAAAGEEKTRAGAGAGALVDTDGDVGGDFKSVLQLLHDDTSATKDEAGAATKTAEMGSGSEVEAASGCLGDDVHVLWGFSKDFALSGYRVGVLLTHNMALL